MKQFLSAGLAALGMLATLAGCGIGAYDPQITVLNSEPEYDIVVEDVTLTKPPAPETDVIFSQTAATVISVSQEEPETPDDPPEELSDDPAPDSDAPPAHTDAPQTTKLTAETTKTTKSTKSIAQETKATKASKTTKSTTQTTHTTTVTTDYTTEALTETTRYEVSVKPDKYGTYTTKDDVAIYIYVYHELPHNFITKKEAQALGWEGGSLEPYAPGCCIGGSSFGNYEGLLPEKDGREYYECDINTLGKKSRGAERIVYSNDGLIYYTSDHYQSFELLYGEVET